ncbi:DNA-directed DNA polymerase [Lentibacillus sp. JNUCC-1]|nr:DNA-directed DNA polymerase [Lentibacillus sp. JNUCC-1]
MGEKTALKLLKQFETLDAVYENLEDVSGKKLKENLENHKEDAFMSRELVTIKRDTPITISLNDIGYETFDPQKVNQFFKELGFKSLLRKVENNDNDDTDHNQELADIDYEVVRDITPDMLEDPSVLIVEILSDNYHTAPVEGIAVVNEHHKLFIPNDVIADSAPFKKWAEDEKQKKTVFDAKQTRVSLLNHGIQIKGIHFDALLASYLIDPSENHHDIPSIANRMSVDGVQYDEEVYGKGAKLKRPDDEVLGEHLVRKASALHEMESIMTEELKANDQLELLTELELPLALILGDMEHTGVQVDVDRLKEMGEDLKKRLDDLANDIYELAGETFNLNSPKQLGPILFEKLGLPVIKKTKTGYSTAADVLEQLEGEHDIIPKLLLYRQLGKLQSTYIEGLLKVVDEETQKIHTRFNQALTQTGRLSSIEPNLQNIPIRLEEGRKIRQAFVPSEPGWVMFAADYSQIELRVLAHIAEDEKLIEAFKEGEDIHTKTAMDVFHVDRNDVTANMRRQSKAVNFGIVYGISDYGLSQNLGITRKEAKTFIERYFESYPGVKEYMDNIVKEAKQNGYVTTLKHRRRYLPEITSRNFNRRSFAGRTAMNTPIQGSAADIIKQAMIDLKDKLLDENMQARMLLQVHDELILEAPQEEIEQLKEMVPAVMEHTMELAVPLKVEYAYGDSWFDAK